MNKGRSTRCQARGSSFQFSQRVTAIGSTTSRSRSDTGPGRRRRPTSPRRRSPACSSTSWQLFATVTCEPLKGPSGTTICGALRAFKAVARGRRRGGRCHLMSIGAPHRRSEPVGALNFDDSAIQLVDVNGNEVGGSGIAGSSISVQD
jgi:hypothetical protein